MESARLPRKDLLVRAPAGGDRQDRRVASQAPDMPELATAKPIANATRPAAPVTSAMIANRFVRVGSADGEVGLAGSGTPSMSGDILTGGTYGGVLTNWARAVGNVGRCDEPP